MAKKKFLQENGDQVWPISRADCIYTTDGKKLLSEDYASKDFVGEAIANIELMTDDDIDAIIADIDNI